MYKKVLLLSLILFYFVDFSSGDEEEESGKKRKHENSLKSEGQLDRRRLVQTEMLLMPDTRAWFSITEGGGGIILVWPPSSLITQPLSQISSDKYL